MISYNKWGPLTNKPQETSVEEISSTKFSDFSNCLRLGRYSWDLNIKPIQPGLALIYGGAIHAAFAEYFRGHDMRKQITAFDDYWLQFAENRQDSKRNPQNALAIIRELNVTKPSRQNVLAVEAPFIVPLTRELIWTGVIDLLEIIGGYMVVTDHKTTSFLNTSFWAPYQAQASYQPISYMRGAALTTGKPVNMYSINAIHILKEPKTKFERRFYSVNQSEIDSFPALVAAFWQTVQNCRLSGHWPKNEKFCGRYGECAYITLCGSPGIDYSKEENISRLPADFHIAPWDNVRQLRGE